MRRRRAEAAQAHGGAAASWGTASEDAVPIVLDANSVKGPLKDWVGTAQIAGAIKASFRQFLETCAPLPHSCFSVLALAQSRRVQQAHAPARADAPQM